MMSLVSRTFMSGELGLKPFNSLLGTLLGSQLVELYLVLGLLLAEARSFLLFLMLKEDKLVAVLPQLFLVFLSDAKSLSLLLV